MTIKEFIKKEDNQITFNLNLFLNSYEKSSSNFTREIQRANIITMIDTLYYTKYISNEIHEQLKDNFYQIEKKVYGIQ